MFNAGKEINLFAREQCSFPVYLDSKFSSAQHSSCMHTKTVCREPDLFFSVQPGLIAV